MPTIPAPMIALTRLDVAPATVLLCSFVDGSCISFLIVLRVPPGVDTCTSCFRDGVDGAKNGEFGGSGGALGAIVYCCGVVQRNKLIPELQCSAPKGVVVYFAIVV